MADLKKLIRDVPGFPKKGIVFKDITPLLRDAKALKAAVNQIAAHYKGQKIDAVLGVEARGFVLAPAVALKLGAGFIPARKPGKLPWKTTSASYQLEYGTDALEIHTDSVAPGQRILMVDDLLATGGTMSACCKLVEQLGGQVVGCAFLIELSFLNGRKSLPGRDVLSLIQYDQP
ncbi:MAG: adenine phosphoribosyltransferase [Planctomycetes bacterium]|nr:adenine phosphoribosyltransferase [Planctomycetota bacterium]MBM4083619.1 adenine phosphoribosyltransferase [Planctomycetota bacterium]